MINKLDWPSIQTRHSLNEIEKISQAIKSADTFSLGKYLADFENNFSKFLNVKHCFGVNSATSALEIAALISQSGENDEILLPAHTYTASALPFLRLKSKLIFVDIDQDTFLMDLNDLQNKITKKSKVIVAPHLYGLSLNMNKLMQIAKENNLFVIEDCAQSPGAEYDGIKVGTFGNIGCFSFHTQKNITTLGEGGMIVTNNDKIAHHISSMRKIGHAPYENQKKYWIPAMSNIIETLPGKLPSNFKMSEINAFAGNLILKRYDSIVKSRKYQFEYISEKLKDYPELKFQKIPQKCKSVYHLMPAKFDGSNFNATNHDLINDLYCDYNIKCVVQYYPLYKYDLFIKNGYSSKINYCKMTEDFYDNMISFPFKSHMDKVEMDYLIKSVKNVINKYKN